MCAAVSSFGELGVSVACGDPTGVGVAKFPARWLCSVVAAQRNVLIDKRLIWSVGASSFERQAANYGFSLLSLGCFSFQLSFFFMS
jgi:hypothetical protein